MQRPGLCAWNHEDKKHLYPSESLWLVESGEVEYGELSIIDRNDIC